MKIDVAGITSLAQLPKPPRILNVKGDISLLSRPAIAVVGARQPTPLGLRAATEISADLVKSGFVVVSGLARGIDGAAHRSALQSNGKTVAVLGHGLNYCYPNENRVLFERIEKEGLLISEYDDAVSVKKHQFPERNRIIAALAKAVVVIEAALDSGSLITAQWAADLGRDVFVVPGSYCDWRYQGSHRLIQSGAKVVCGINDILSEYSNEVFEEKLGAIIQWSEILERFDGIDSEARRWLEEGIERGTIEKVAFEKYFERTLR